MTNSSILKDIDICLLELREDVIEQGRINQVLLRTICLPDKKTLSGSKCYTSGLQKDKKIIDAVPLNLFNETYCNEDDVYSHFDISLNINQLCAGIPSRTKSPTRFIGNYDDDFGAPLICIDKISKIPIFTGVSSSNTFSTRNGYPGLIRIRTFQNDNVG